VVGRDPAPGPAGRVGATAQSLGADGAEALGDGVVHPGVDRGERRDERPTLLGLGASDLVRVDLGQPLTDAIGEGQQERRAERAAARPGARRCVTGRGGEAACAWTRSDVTAVAPGHIGGSPISVDADRSAWNDRHRLAGRRSAEQRLGGHVRIVDGHEHRSRFAWRPVACATTPRRWRGGP
jgi:hypothetical protein